MLAWLQSVAEWAGPIAAILNFLVALVGVPVAIWKGRQARDAIVRWFTSILGSAQAASDQSADAALDAKRAADNASGTQRTVLELKDAHGRIVEWLPEGDEAVEYLKETNSRLVAQLVIQAKRHPEDFESPDVPRFIVPTGTHGETGPITVTGKHRLHTALIDTGQILEPDYEPDPEQEQPW